jgi:hypothetical protein
MLAFDGNATGYPNTEAATLAAMPSLPAPQKQAIALVDF